MVEEQKKWNVSDLFKRITSEQYSKLLDIGRRQMQRERPGHTLQPGDVVHESLDRLRKSGMEILNTQHLYASAATQMRWLLVEHARKRRRRPYMTQIDEVSDEALNVQDHNDTLLLELHDGINRLEFISPEAAKICELHYFEGHGVEDIASFLEISIPTVGRRLRFARAWLNVELSKKGL